MYSIINYLDLKKRGARHHASTLATRGGAWQGAQSHDRESQDSAEDEEEGTTISRPRSPWERVASSMTTGSATSHVSRDETDQSEPSPASSGVSLDEIEGEDDKNDQTYTPLTLDSDDLVIDPNGKVAYYWMGTVATAVMYNCAVIILRVAFTELREHSIYPRIFATLDNVSDLIYLVDIVMQARTAFLEDGCLVRDPERLLRHYRSKTRFFLDVGSIMPFATVYGMFTAHLAEPIMRIGRLLKYHTLAQFFQTTDSHTSNPNLLRAFKLSVHLWMVIHWIGCIYYMLSEYEGLGSNEWVYPAGEEYNALSRKYILSTYWSTMTLTTIGERPSPVTDLEFVFTGMIFLIGVFVFAAVVGNVGDVISNMYAARQDFQTRMDQIKFYMHHRQVPEHLQDRVKKWADYTWNRTKAIDEPSVLQLLPERLRTEIAIHVHLDTLKKVKIFEECEEGLLRELVLKLRPQIYSPGDYICRIGEIGREMYILNHGRVEILVPGSEDGQKTQVAILTPGNYFGEISLLKLDEGQNRRTADVRAIGYSELLCLSRRDLFSALVEYPNAKEILEAQAKERMNHTKGVTKIPARLATATPKKRARDIFANVMRQEGFSKLLSARGQEMSELRKVIDELRVIANQANQGRNKTKCECADLQRQLRKKERALRKASRRVIELETVLRFRRSASMPLSVQNQVPRQDSTQSERSYPTWRHDEMFQRIYDVGRGNNGARMHKNIPGSNEFLRYEQRSMSSASTGTSFDDHYHPSLMYQDSLSSSVSRSQSFDFPSTGIANNECDADSKQNGNSGSDGNQSNHDIQHGLLSDSSFLDKLDAAFQDTSFLTDSALSLSDDSSNTDSSEITDIDDL